jgi:hypothetical protein
MKYPNSKLADRLIIGSLSVVLGVAGAGVAYSQFMVTELPWQQYRLPNPPDGAADISRVDLRSFGDDPSGDTIFIVTNDGDKYSYTLFEGQWLDVDTLPKSDFQATAACAPDWPGAQSDADIWDPPPVERKVRDSAGERIEHALAIFVRCYVLSDDSSLELWTREDDPFEIMGFMQCAPVYILVGGLLGAATGLIVVRTRKWLSTETTAQ